jgi:Spy/CpxP family protein refolding chaperone
MVMNNLQQVQKYGLLVAAGLLCLSLTAAVQVSAADQGASGSAKGPGSFMQPCNCPADWHAGKGPAYMRHQRQRMSRALKQLNLTDAQKTSIHDIRITLKKRMIEEGADLKIAKIELREQLRKDSVEMSAVEAQLKKVESIRTAMKLDAIKARMEIKNKLTPDQRKKLAELMRNPWQGNVQRPQKG